MLTYKDKALRTLVPSYFQINQRNTHWNIKKYLNWARECPLQGIIANLEGMKERKEREIVLRFAPYPFLYIIGEHDPLFQSEALEVESKSSTSGSYVLLENAGHMAPLESIDQTFNAIFKFVKKLGR
jgi:pimeloyl-ACP methyl ester carboxylesterase